MQSSYRSAVEIEQWIPHQRTVGEYPKVIGIVGSRGHGFGQRSVNPVLRPAKFERKFQAVEVKPG